MGFFEQVGQMFADVAHVRPPVIAIHDLHLADPASAQLLAYVLRTLAPTPGLGGEGAFTGLFVVTTSDGDLGGATPALLADVATSVVRLEGLDTDGLRAWLSSPSVLERLRQQTGGVPRRLESLLDHTPPDASAIVVERLAALGPGAARLCRALALHGRPAGAAFLERLASALGAEDSRGLGEVDVQELRGCQLLSRSVLGGELRLGFASSADRAAVVKLIPGADAVALHRAIGDTLLASLESGEDPTACAEHLLEGQAGERSIDVALVAGEALERSFAYERAIALYGKALLCTARPDVITALEQRLADLFELTGDYTRALEVVERLRVRCPEAATTARAGHLSLQRGDFGTARATLAVAREQGEAAGDLATVGRALADLAECHFLEGAHDAALTAGNDALAIEADGEGGSRVRLAARNSLGKVYLEKGDYARAAAFFGENLREASAAGILFEVSRAHINLGIAALRAGDYETAETHYRQGLNAAREHGDVRHRAFCLQNLGVLAQWRRDYTAALRYYQDAVDAFKRLGHRPWLAWVALDLGDLYLGLGDLGRAQAMADLAGRMTSEVATTSVILENLRGRILLERGDFAGARTRLEAGLDQAARIDNKDELSLSLLFLARLELADAQPEAALGHLAGIPTPCSSRTMSQLLALRGEARATLRHHDAARADLVAADRAFADLGDDEGRLRVLLVSAALADATGDVREGRRTRQLARDLDEKLRARVPSDLAPVYGRDPARLALSDRPTARLAPAPSTPTPAPRAERPTPPPPVRADRFPRIVGHSVEIAHVVEMVERVAPHDSLVLIRGESGTGKELVAEAIHEASRRRGRPFVKVNCGALVESLLLSELFGHERGAFTGALQRRKGRFELADGGTLFLDEIGDISPQTQVALLRVLQTHEFERVGGTQPVRVDVRIVCATNRDLEGMVADGRFREDLYYRLKGIEIDVPALRARQTDIPDLVRHFLARIADERQAPVKQLTPSGLEALVRYPWPGNIRELENVVRSVTLFADGEEIDVRDLAEYIGSPAPRATGSGPAIAVATPGAHAERQAPPRRETAPDDVYAWAVGNGVSLRDLKRKIELECITQALAECGGNITRAAEKLGMKRPRLSQLLKEHGIAPGREGGRGTEDRS